MLRPARALLVILPVFVLACSDGGKATPDSGVTDGAVADATPRDGAVLDAAQPDAAQPDAAQADAAVPDASLPDATVPDAAPADAAPPAPLILIVDAAAAAGGDGSATMPYQGPAEALVRARAVVAAEPQRTVIIQLRAGVYTLLAPLVLDVAGLELRGANLPIKDSGGLPTGLITAGTDTRLTPAATWDKNAVRLDANGVPVLKNPSLVKIVADRVTVANLSFDAALITGGGVVLSRAQGFRVVDSACSGGATCAELVAASGTIQGCYMGGNSVGVLIAGGNAATPAVVTITQNRVVTNSTGGVLVNGGGTGVAGLYDTVTAVITDNELSGSTGGVGTSFGVRLFPMRRDAPDPENQSTSTLTATVMRNRITGNEVGIAIDAGFPYRIVGTTCDPRVFSSVMHVTLGSNQVSGNNSAPAVIATTRLSAVVNRAQAMSWQYLHNAAIDIADPNSELAGAKIEHPAMDPYLGTCPHDAASEPLGNRITVNGTDLPNQMLP